MDQQRELQRLLAEFSRFGIDPSHVGFCDSSAFLAAEKNDPSFLENYAKYVALRSYDDRYIERVKSVVPAVAEILLRQLIETGRLGACVDISGIMSKTLDKLGIWNYCVKGSLTVEFPSSSGIPPQYYWTIDYGNYTAAHAWVTAPPFEVVDIAVRQQPCATEERDLLPCSVVACDLKRGKAVVEDLVSDTARVSIAKRGIRNRDVLDRMMPDLPRFLKYFPVGIHVAPNGTQLKYIPVAIGGPDAPLEGLAMMKFSGKSPYEVYQDIILPALGDSSDA